MSIYISWLWLYEQKCIVCERQFYSSLIYDVALLAKQTHKQRLVPVSRGSEIMNPTTRELYIKLSMKTIRSG